MDASLESSVLAENDGPSKLQDMKLQDVEMTDQVAGHEIAEYENDGHEIAGQNNKKMQFSLFFIFVSRNSVPCYMVVSFRSCNFWTCL